MSKSLSCGTKFIRILFLVSNTIYLLVSLTLIGLGIYIQVNDNFSATLNELAKVSNFQGQSLGFLAFVLIGGGIITFIIALAGYAGALWRHRCLVYIYIIILIILILIELVGLILAFAYRSVVENIYKDNLLKVFSDAVKNNNVKVLKPFHQLEESLKCCGVNDFRDYGKSGKEAPSYCYEPEYSSGCSTLIIDWLSKNLPIIGGILSFVFFIEFFGLICAIIFARVLGRNYNQENDSSEVDLELPLVIAGHRRNYFKFR